MKKVNEKGSMSIMVIVTVLALAVILMAIFLVTLGQEKEQLQSNLKIKEIYGQDVNRIEDVYNEVISNMQNNI